MTEEHQPSLTERLLRMSTEARSRAEATPPGPERDALLNEAKASDNALHVQQWLSSGLRAPT